MLQLERNHVPQLDLMCYVNVVQGVSNVTSAQKKRIPSFIYSDVVGNDCTLHNKSLILCEQHNPRAFAKVIHGNNNNNKNSYVSFRFNQKKLLR